MAVLIVFLPFVLALVRWRRRLGYWRTTFLTAAIAWGLLAVSLTEFLSLFNWITPLGLTIGWCIASAGVWLGTPLLGPMPHEASEANEGDGENWVRWVAAYLGVLAGVLGFVAWFGPANNIDSMTYHLPRVMHWMQDRNIEFYPVPFYPFESDPVQAVLNSAQVRQLTMPPASEYFILNLMSLSGSDHWAGMVQWFAYVGCLIGVSSVARLLGAGTRGQALAALLAGTLPIVCMESVTEQNDLVCAFWMICFIWAVLRIYRGSGGDGPSAGRFNLAVCGISLGLALLTKSTAYLFAAPLAAGLAGLLLIRGGGLGRIAVVAVIAVLINTPMYIRDYRFSGTLLGNSNDRFIFTNEPISVGFTVSNVVRNIALELSLNQPVADAVQRAALRIHQALGLDVDAPGSTFQTTRFRFGQFDWHSEDNAPNPLHFLLLAAGIVSLALGRPRGNMLLWLYLAGIGAGFVTFCAYLRWQPWHARLLLVPCIIAAPWIAVVLQFWNRRAVAAIALLFAMAIIPWIVLSTTHPWVGPKTIFTMDRDARRFIRRPQFEAAFQRVADAAAHNGCRQVGIIWDGENWEYPLLALIKERDPGVRFETYPDSHFVSPVLFNQGWNPSLKPYIIVRFDHGVPSIVGQS